ncbi:MAG: pantetheine-phosphate adenylyltransferase [Christensenellaceae bacterium]
MKRCVFAGTFDPPTIGHVDMIRQCRGLFDEVVVAILVNPEKHPFFTLEEREEMLRLTFEGTDGVRIRSYGGLVVDLLREEGTPYYVRGIRNGADYDYENLTQFINRSLYPELVTIYLPTLQEHLHVSSSLVRNSIRFHKGVEAYVPQEILPYIRSCIQKRGL